MHFTLDCLHARQGRRVGRLEEEEGGDVGQVRTVLCRRWAWATLCTHSDMEGRGRLLCSSMDKGRWEVGIRPGDAD